MGSPQLCQREQRRASPAPASAPWRRAPTRAGTCYLYNGKVLCVVCRKPCCCRRGTGLAYYSRRSPSTHSYLSPWCLALLASPDSPPHRDSPAVDLLAPRVSARLPQFGDADQEITQVILAPQHASCRTIHDLVLFCLVTASFTSMPCGLRSIMHACKANLACMAFAHHWHGPETCCITTE